MPDGGGEWGTRGRCVKRWGLLRSQLSNAKRDARNCLACQSTIIFHSTFIFTRQSFQLDSDMADILNQYTQLTNNSDHSATAAVLQSIIDAPPSKISPEKRIALIGALLRDLSDCGPEIPGRLRPREAAQALLALKTLAKVPRGSAVLVIPANLSLLLSFTAKFADDAEAANEALRCIANATLLIEAARSTFIEDEVNGGNICMTLLQTSTSPEQIFALCRILFLCTSSGPPYLEILVDADYGGQTIVELIAHKLGLLLDQVLSGANMAKEAMVDLLKLTFNILNLYPKMVQTEPQGTRDDDDDDDTTVMGDYWSSKLNGLLEPLLKIYSTLPPTSPSPIVPPLVHVIHSLITIPIIPALHPIWFPNPPGPSPESADSTNQTPPTRSSPDSSHTPPSGVEASSAPPSNGTFDILRHSFNLLDATLAHYFPGAVDPDEKSVRDRVAQDAPGNTVDDLITPLMVLISRICLADEPSRARVRQWLVPFDLDRTSPLERRKNTLGRCLRLLGSVYHSRAKTSVGEMLFAMADSNATTLSALVGYGNVAGFLFHKGVMSAPAQDPTESTASLTTSDGYAINPITGTTVQPKPEAPEMSDDEKEREMEKLFILFDRMERIGALDPNSNPVRKAIRKKEQSG
ncbi:hypothetical protein BDN72DRAFT_846320 [Pluteus cervinus]|uniref:Uncharacterized protein n=1 Tax=Pluteus cervinus TaxID=181527 RepID=A0ACD3AFM1_9AGAR|nr:hypothetical protein BDN72DRAFT_846320 [Pluteus cervinus]